MKVCLVPPSFEYEDAIQRYASDPDVSATTNVPFPYPAGGARRWLEAAANASRSGSAFRYIVLYDRRFAGVVALNGIRDGRLAHLDYWIARPLQGRGIGTEAGFEAVRLARDVHHLRVLFSGCVATNDRSRHLLERLGFRPTTMFINRGLYGTKFLGRPCARYRIDLVPAGQEIIDPDIPGPAVEVETE